MHVNIFNYIYLQKTRIQSTTRLLPFNFHSTSLHIQCHQPVTSDGHYYAVWQCSLLSTAGRSVHIQTFVLLWPPISQFCHYHLQNNSTEMACNKKKTAENCFITFLFILSWRHFFIVISVWQVKVFCSVFGLEGGEEVLYIFTHWPQIMMSTNFEHYYTIIIVQAFSTTRGYRKWHCLFIRHKW